MLYNHEKDLKSTEERIKSSGISEANKQLIFEFESYCFAEGLRIFRTLKHLTEAQMKQYLRWVQGSDMAAIYVHLSGRDVDNALLKMHCIVTEDTKDTQMSPKQCSRCMTMNSPTTKFCSKCGLPLDIKTALEMEEKSSDVSMDFMQLAKNNPK